MTAISRVVPEAKNLLCIWRINKNVPANAKKHFANDEDWNEFLKKWYGLCFSSTEQEFEGNWVLLKDAIDETGYAYLHSTWIPHKEKFILAWTKKVKHFGHVATSRVEGGHAILKKWVAVSTGSWKQFMTDWFSQLNSGAKE